MEEGEVKFKHKNQIVGTLKQSLKGETNGKKTRKIHTNRRK